MSFYVHPASTARSLSPLAFLARHAVHDEVGQVLSGRSEIALNEAGERQAARLAERLADAAIEAIVTSPRRRARQTAEAVGARIGIAPVATTCWDEIDFGEWTGKGFDELADDPRWRNWNAARGRATTPGGETMGGVARRAADDLEARCRHGNVLFVSHGDVIRALVAHYSGSGPAGSLCFEVDPASITTLRIAAGLATVVSVNERVP